MAQIVETTRALGTRAEQAGMFLAAASVPRSFQRTLMPRSVADQGVVTGVMVAANYGIAAFLQDVIEAASERVVGEAAYREDDERWRRLTSVADLAAMFIGFAAQSAFRQRRGERLWRGALRTGGWYLSMGGFGGLGAAAGQELSATVGRKVHLAVPLAVPLGAGLSAVMAYRGDLAAFVNEAYGFGASPDKLRRVEEALRRYEMRFAEYVEQARRSQATEASG